ncbi:MAG: RusA family crossover junction endodeoxyribonuclease [Alphaproteobacteria bacterium]
MVEPVTFTLLGQPCGKGRARAYRRGNFIAHYTPEKTRSYESMIRGAASEAMRGRTPIDVPVEMTMVAVFGVPASWSKKKQAAALTGEIRPGSKPDVSNIAKAVEDAINGVVLRDDSLIVDSHTSKRYGPQPMVAVTVRAA